MKRLYSIGSLANLSLTLLFCQGLFGFQLDNQLLPQNEPILLNSNSSWCWFQDDRAILQGDEVLFSGVTSEGSNTITRWNITSQETQTVILSEKSLPADDHNVGALMARPDGRFLAVYAGHGVDSLVRSRISEKPGDISEWEPEKQIKTNGRVTYSNVYRLSDSGITYNFYRGNESNPHYLISRDDGSTWEFGGRLFEFEGRSYLRYASDGKKRIHFIATDGHPRHFNNNIYHGYLEDGQLYRTDGKLVGPISKTTNSPYKPSDFTLVYNGNLQTRTDVSWTNEIKLDQNGYPYISFSVTKDPLTRGETKNTELGGFDHRYHYARWNGKNWQESEIAFAGSRLYPGENEYTGLISLHPSRTNVVYISSDVNPKTGKPLLVKEQRRYEIFRGETFDEGKTWEWIPITFQSDEDNIRPIVLADETKECVIWLNGRYTTYRDYDLKVYGINLPLRPQVVTYPPENSDKHVLFLVSEDPDNYEAHLTVPAFAARLSAEKGYKSTVIKGEGPRNSFHLPKLEQIEEADLLVLFLRRVALSTDQMKMIKNHLAKGRPVIGIRTANHAFSVRNEEIPQEYEDWWDFVPDVLGHENQGYGTEREKTRVNVTPEGEKHPLLKDVTKEIWYSKGNLYLVNPLLDKKTEIIMMGQSDEHKEPLAWTRKAGESKVFYTSLGYPTDFAFPSFIQLLFNSIDWALE